MRTVTDLCVVNYLYLVSIHAFPFAYQEIDVLSQLKHPNIVQYYGSEIVSFFIIIVIGSYLFGSNSRQLT